jgi:hypothetical protein
MPDSFDPTNPKDRADGTGPSEPTSPPAPHRSTDDSVSIDPDLTTGSVETDRSRLPGFPGAFGSSGIPTHPALPTRPGMPGARNDASATDSASSTPTGPENPTGAETPTGPETPSYDTATPETGAFSTIQRPGDSRPATDGAVVVAPLEPYYAVYPEQDSVPDPADVPMLRPRPERIRSAAIVGVRVVSGTIGVLVAAAVVAAVALLPIPSVTITPPSVTVTPTATAQQLVCPGAVLSLTDDTGRAATTASAIGSPLITSSATRGEVTDTPLAETDANSGGGEAAPQVLSDDAVDDSTDTEPGLISGVQAQSLTEGDNLGLAAASCATASSETWLVGGSNETGRTTLLTLSNPSEVVATVDLEIFSEAGVVTSPGLTGISVEAGAQRVLSLSGFAPQAVSPVVHVESRGGLVVANLQQSIVRGIESGGVDIVGGSQAPSETNVIPGVVVRSGGPVGARSSEEGYSDLQPVLRMYVPGDASAAVRVDVTGEDASSPSSSFTLDVEGGIVTDLPLDGLDDGRYTVTIDSDAPAIAGVRVSTMGGADVAERTDFAWLATAAELTSDTLVSIPRGADASLHLANTTGAEIQVVVTALSGPREGSEATATIGAGASFVASVDAGASYRLTGFDSLHASVSSQTDGGVAGFTVVPPAEATTPVQIYP